MYKNSGKTLKKLAVAITSILMVITFIIDAIVIMTIILPMISRGYNATAIIMTLVIGTIISLVLAYLISLTLHAFGQLVDDVHAIRGKLEKRKDESSEQNYALPPL